MSGKSVYRWTAIDRIGNTIITFGGNLLMANLLDPFDFGLLSMVAIFSALAYNISGCGMSDGLINKTDPSARDYSTVFVFNILMGAGFCILFVASSGLVADCFEYPQLKGIMIAIGICFFFQSMVLIQETKMRKDLDFKSMALVHLLSSSCALVLGIVLVIKGYGYWGLVATQIFVSVFLFIFFMAFSRWMPRLAFYKDSFRELFGYGFHLMLAFVCYQFARNVNSSVLGKYSSGALAGAYGQAQKIEDVPFALTDSILNWPFFSVLSSIVDSEDRRKAVARMHSVIIFVNASLAAFLFVISAYAFKALYGSKWDAAIPIFNILLVYGLASSVKLFYQTVFKSHSMTRLIRNLTFAEMLAQLALLVCVYDRSAEMIAMTMVEA